MTAKPVTWSSVKVVATTLHFAREKKGLELIKQFADVGAELGYHASYLKASSRNPAASQWGCWHHLREIEELANEILLPLVARLIEMQPKVPEWSRHFGRIAGAAKILITDANNAIQASSTLMAASAIHPRAYLFGRIGERADELARAACAAVYCAEARVRADEAA